MKIRLFVAPAMLLLASTALGQQPDLKTLQEKASYIIGNNIGQNFRQQQLELDLRVFLRGVEDGLRDIKPKMSEEEIQKTMQALQKEIAAKNKKSGEEFLSKNKTQTGVKTLPSGLQYKELKSGTGKSPGEKDSVTVHYSGKLLNGTEFDSSYARKMPATFQVNQVIKGWTEGLQLMKEGAKWMLFIPAELAYGEMPPPQSGIPQGAVLVFQVELLKVN